MNKIINSFYIKPAWVLFFSVTAFSDYAQQGVLNKYGLLVINSYTEYQTTISNDPTKEMVDIKTLDPEIIFDLKYAGKNNFTRTTLYPPIKTSFLRKPVATALASVQQQLIKQGFGLKIFDAYRPYSITEKMWALVKDDRYAADPKSGSGHNRGIAVDLTIINLKTKKEVNMGTGFDNFSDTAHHNFTNLPDQVLHNRLLLRKVMEKNGFKALETEWWHYSYSNGTVFELMDINFDDLKKHKK